MRFISIEPEGTIAFDDEIKKHNLMFVKFHLPGCPHCENVKSVWNNLQNSGVLNNKGITLMNVDANSIQNSNSKCVKQLIGYPTIMKISKSGNCIKEYQGDLTENELTNFIINNSKTKSSNKKKTSKKTRTKSKRVKRKKTKVKTRSRKKHRSKRKSHTR